MNRKLKTNRKEIEQQMQKKLRELVRYPFRPSDPVSRKISVKGQCRRCRLPLRPSLYLFIPIPVVLTSEWQGLATQPLQPMSQVKTPVQTTSSKKNPRSKGALGPK